MRLAGMNSFSERSSSCDMEYTLNLPHLGKSNSNIRVWQGTRFHSPASQ
ncbi:Uncharacterised protein [Vibrio cholerae]|nr:Uncharacterised protein [Vibrio cholerae]